MRRGLYRSHWRPSSLPVPQVADLRARAGRRGAWVLLSAVGLGIAYLAITDEPIRRGWFVAALAASVPLILDKLLPWDRLLSRRLGGALMLARYTLLALVVSLGVASTGGRASQLWMLYTVVLLFVGWCFDALTQGLFGAAVAVMYTVAMALSGGLPTRGVLFARLASLAVLALAVSLVARESRDQAERALVAAREASAEAEARRAVAEQAQRLSLLQSEFVSTVSHELRTPLTAIIGNLATLQRGVVKDREVAETLLAAAARHAKRLNDLIEDLLTTSRLDDGEVKVRSDDVDVLEVASDVVSQLQAARPGGDLSLLVDGDLPPSAVTDRDHLHRVLLNLADNALKYGRGAPVRVRVGRVGHRVRLVVEDEGPGIDPRYHLRIFERFAQVDGGDRPKVGGTGLGLHICARLVERLGGHLTVSSLPGAGAAFAFTLPASAVESVVPAPPLVRAAG